MSFTSSSSVKCVVVCIVISISVYSKFIDSSETEKYCFRGYTDILEYAHFYVLGALSIDGNNTAPSPPIAGL